MTANGGSLQYRSSGTGSRILDQIDGGLDRLSRWNREDVGPAFDTAILDAASSGKDNWGRFLTGMRVVATASSDAVSGTATLGRLITSAEARDAFFSRAGEFLEDLVGNISRAFDAWTSKAWYEQTEDIYKVFQTGAAGVGLAGKARILFSVGALDDPAITSLEPNTQRVLSAYQSAYNDAAIAFQRDLAAGSICSRAS